MHASTCTADTHAAPIHHATSPTIPHEGHAHTHTCTHKRGILILLFYHAGKERGERHHGYDPPGAE